MKFNKRNKTKSKKQKNGQNKIMTDQIKAVSWFALAVFILAGIQFPAQTGYFGLILNYFFRTLLGEAAPAFPILIGVAALSSLCSLKIKNRRYRLAGLLILFFLLTVTLHLMLILQGLDIFARKDLYRAIFNLGWQQQGGGLIGAVLTIILFFFFKDIGSYIVLSALGIISLLLITNSSLLDIFSNAMRFVQLIFQFIGRLVKNFHIFCMGEGSGEPLVENYSIKEYSNYKGNYESNALEGEKKEGEAHREKNGAEDANEITEADEAAPIISVYHNIQESLAQRNSTGENNVLTAEDPEENGFASSINQASTIFQSYRVPSLALLTKIDKLRDHQQQKVIQERARALRGTFESFGVKVKIREIQAGPAVTRFEIQPETGVKVSKILSLSDDLALNLAAPDVRIEAPIPGKAAIGIEVPNKIISVVYLKEVLEDPCFQSSSSPLTIGLGKDIAGTSVFADLLKMPHLLIAGSTGSGKSVCINTIISSILFKANPWTVKFLLIDPKLVELSIYNGIPHLLSPVITEPKKAAMALRGMVKEMIRRYDLFARQGVRDINSYNKLCFDDKQDFDNREDFLPYIIVVIDELADLMMVAPAEVEDSIVRLSQMSRAAGIHLIIATQRPSVDIITGLIKANITSRIAFAVSSQIDSRTILDAGGAEKLLGRGDMLYYPIGVHKPLRVQGAFISEKDITKIIEFIREQESPLYQESLLFNPEESELDIEEEEEKAGDPLLPEIVELIIQTGHASISLIQRRFRVGYTRAARLIDELELLGIVGGFEGSKPRKVIMNREQALNTLRQGIKTDDD